MNYRGKSKGNYGQQRRSGSKNGKGKHSFMASKVETYPYLNQTNKDVFAKLATVLYDGQTQKNLVLTAETARKNLDDDVGFLAEENDKKYVVLHEDSGMYEWYGFNNESDWLPLYGPSSLKEQVTETDALYLLKHAKRHDV